jgi:hypothetical protein
VERDDREGKIGTETMIGTVAIIWTDRGVLTERGKVVAGPDEKIFVDSITAERFIKEGKAKYPRH